MCFASCRAGRCHHIRARNHVLADNPVMRRMLALLLALPLIASVVAAPSPTPSTRDLTVKTERRMPLGHEASVTTTATYFSGARQRRETVPHDGRDRALDLITIRQCDERRTLILNPESRLYAFMPDGTSAFRRLIQPVIATPPPDPSGATVTMTVDAVDTGQRRQVGSYVARRVKTTRTKSAAGVEKSVGEQDGWYLDLPDLSCGDEGETMLVLVPDNASLRVEHRGRARRGFAIEETDRDESGNIASTIKLIEFSEAPLDDGLFAVPPGYRAAVPLLSGGHDMTRPDTVRNRLQSYWVHAIEWASSVFR